MHDDGSTTGPRLAAVLQSIPDPGALLTSVFEHAPIGLQIYDVTGRSLAVNPAFVRMFGSVPPPEYCVLRDEEAVRNGVDGLIRRSFQGETVTLPPTWMDPRALRHVKVERANRVYIEPTFFPLRDVHGAVTHVAVAFRDLTTEATALEKAREDHARLRESEARFRRLHESGVIGIVFWNLEGGLVEANDAFLRMVGYSREDLVSGRVRWRDMTPPEFAQLDAKAVRELEATGICTPYEKTFRHRDGHSVPILLGAALWEGSLNEGVAWILDVTEKKRSEQQQGELLVREQGARREAEAANRAKDEFLSILSHELRTPLTAIMGWLQVLRGKKGSPEMLDRAVEVIERNARAQVQLIEDILDVSRIVTGKLRLDMVPVDPARVVKAAVDVVMPAAAARGVALDVGELESLPIIAADAGRLQQVAWNLLSNAVKFTPAGGRVTVRVREAAGRIVLVVEDTGQGIAPEVLPLVFDRFKQGDSATTRAHGGLGLGLSIVKHLVELHGGAVTAESGGVGKGARFTVSLPAARASTLSVVRRTGELPVDRRGLLMGVRVLVVDDEKDARDMLALLLAEHGAGVTLAASADEALAAIRSGFPDVMVADLGMPGKDGYSLMQEARALLAASNRTLPAVALTAFAGAQDARRAYLAGYQLHLAKPVPMDHLVEAVARLAARDGTPVHAGA